MSEIRHRILLSSRDYIVWPDKPWRFSATWARLALVGNALSAPNCPFTIWPDPPLVEKVQRLAVLGQKAEIRALLYPEEV